MDSLVLLKISNHLTHKVSGFSFLFLSLNSSAASLFVYTIYAGFIAVDLVENRLIVSNSELYDHNIKIRYRNNNNISIIVGIVVPKQV